MADLSPAAQAVLDAYNAAPPDHSTSELPPDCGRRALAAAIRAAADQVVPEDSLSSFIPGAPRSFELQRRATRRQLLAIAAELEPPHA